MDIPALSMVMAQQQVMTDISLGVLKMSLDSTTSGAESLLSTMEKSVSPHLGQSIDIKL